MSPTLISTMCCKVLIDVKQEICLKSLCSLTIGCVLFRTSILTYMSKLILQLFFFFFFLTLSFSGLNIKHIVVYKMN